MNFSDKLEYIYANKDLQDFLFYCEFDLLIDQDGSIVIPPVSTFPPRLPKGFWYLLHSKRRKQGTFLVLQDVYPHHMYRLVDVLQAPVIEKINNTIAELHKLGYDEVIKSRTHAELKRLKAKLRRVYKKQNKAKALS
jgi:hypothetical protein